jgi:hypothetical protein
VELASENAYAGEVAAGVGETGGEALRDQVATAGEYDRDRRGCIFRRRYSRAGYYDHVDIAADEFRGKCRQAIIAPLGPPVFNRYALSLDETYFAQSVLKGSHKRSRVAGRHVAEKAHLAPK